MHSTSNVQVNDMRSALELLKKTPGQYIETDEPVDLHAELSGVYRYIGASGNSAAPHSDWTGDGIQYYQRSS